MMIDLHVHSDRSDGSLTPYELVREAKHCGVTAIALTDHDTVSGVKEALLAGVEYGLSVIPGIELSAVYGGQDIHILGLNVDIDCPEFADRLEHYRQERQKRNEKMLQLMIAAGLPIDRESFYRRYPSSVITRAHFAEYLLEAGAVRSMKEAFDRYLGPGMPCYLPRKTITCEEAVSCILSGKGHPVLAHPMQYKLEPKELEQLIQELISYGLEGIEAVYTTHTEGQERYLRTLARKYNLQISGGSDFHGSKKPDIRIGTGRGHLYVHHDIFDWIVK